MELERIATRRNLFLLLAGFLVVRGWIRWGHVAKSAYNQRMHPPVSRPAVDPAGQELLDAVELRDRKRLVGRHRRISAKLEEARANGFEVGGLQAKADAALKLNSKALRRQAHRTLSEVELVIPRKKVQYIPMYDTIPEPIAPDAKAARASETESAKKAKKKKKKRRVAREDEE